MIADMKIERHAFISYAHIDNEVLPEENDGWVTRFHKVLAQMLAGRLGEKVNIWRDDALRPGVKFPAEIEDKLKHTAVLISVMSPRYLKSDWCRDELEHFCRLAKGEGGLVVDNRCRVFKVVKLPMDRPDDVELPAELHDTLPYDFYVVENNTPIELDPNYGEQYGQKFLRRVAAVATDLKQVIGLLGTDARVPVAAGPTVYLAATSSDRQDDREILATELNRMGCTVLPDHALPTEEDALVEEVRALLARSRLSIHLIGDRRGLVPDGESQRSLVEIQNDLAVERCRANPMPRVIWAPASLQPRQAEQAAFVQRLHADAGAQLQADLLTGDFEAVRQAVRGAIKRLQEPQAAPVTQTAPPAPPPTQRRAHVLLQAADRRAAVPFLRELQARRARVSLPILSGDAAAMQEANQTLLLESDEVWLYYGAGDETWRFQQSRELDRIRALRPQRPLPPEFLVLAGPDTDDKAVLAELLSPGQVVMDLRSGALPAAAGWPE